MIDNTYTSSQAGFTMPSSWTLAAGSAAVRTLPSAWGVSAVAAAAGTKVRVADVAPVCAHIVTTDVYVLTGAFPGTSAWSPPI